MVINYDHFYLDPALADDYKAVVLARWPSATTPA